MQSNSSSPETNSNVSISNFTQSDAGIYQCVFFTSTEVLTSIPLRLDTGMLALVIVTSVVSMLPLPMLPLWCQCYLCQCYLCGVSVTSIVSMLPLWCQCYLCGVNVTFVVSMLSLWCQFYLCGVNVTSVVSMLPLWCQCYLCGVNVTSVVSVLPLWCQCYLCGVNVTSVVSVLPLWCQCYLCGVNATSVVSLLSSGPVSLTAVSPPLIYLSPPAPVVAEVYAQGEYRSIMWSWPACPSNSTEYIINFGQTLVRTAPSTSDYGPYSASLGNDSNVTVTVIVTPFGKDISC